MWFGYLREELFSSPVDRAEGCRAIDTYAGQFALGPGEIFIEPLAPAHLLWTLFDEVDRRTPTSGILEQIHRVGTELGLDPRRLADSPSTQMLWKAMEAIDGAGGGHLIVPSRAHLTNLGPSGRAVTDRITRMRTADIHYLDAGPPTHYKPTHIPRGADIPENDTDEQVVLRLHIEEPDFIGRPDMGFELAHQDWLQTNTHLDTVCRTLLDDAAAAYPTCGADSSHHNTHTTLRVLHHRRYGELIVELDETRQRLDPLSPAIVELCAHVQRNTRPNRTITRCTLAAQHALTAATSLASASDARP